MNLADFLYDFTRFPQFRSLNAQFVLDVTPQSFVIKRNTEGAYCDVHFSKELFYPYIRPVFLIAPTIITISPNFRMLLNDIQQEPPPVQVFDADADAIAAASAAAAAATSATFVARPIVPNVTRSFRLTSERITSTHAPRFECFDKTMRVVGRINDRGLDERDDRAALLEMSKNEMEERDIKRRKVDKETCPTKITTQCYDTRSKVLLDVQPVDISFETPPPTPMVRLPSEAAAAVESSETKYMDIASALQPFESADIDREVVVQQNKAYTLPDDDFNELLKWLNDRRVLLKHIGHDEGITVHDLKTYIKNNLPSAEYVSEVHDHFKQLDETIRQLYSIGV